MDRDAVLRDLAPTGKLRIAIMYTNPILATGTPPDLCGIAPDLARELAARLEVPLDIVGYETSAARWAAMPDKVWDVTFSAYDAKHADVVFTPPYLASEGTFLVPGTSALREIAQVDREGVRIAVSATSSLDKYLTRSLRHATLERIPGAPAAAELLIAGKADALAGLRQQLLRVQQRLPGSRILDGRFMAIEQALAIRTGHDAGAAYLRAFVEDIKASGMVARLIEEHGLNGIRVAPQST